MGENNEIGLQNQINWMRYDIEKLEARLEALELELAESTKQ